MLGLSDESLPVAPPAPVARLTSVTVVAAMSRTKMFPTPLSSSGDMLSAPDPKAT
jgi:hypothetical protein